MNRTILQIPVSKDLKKSAEVAAEDYGFSSLQEIIRVFMKKLADKKINLTFEEGPIYLSPQVEKRYHKITQDFKKGENMTSAKDIRDLVKKLNVNPLP